MRLGEGELQHSCIFNLVRLDSHCTLATASEIAPNHKYDTLECVAQKAGTVFVCDLKLFIYVIVFPYIQGIRGNSATVL